MTRTSLCLVCLVLVLASGCMNRQYKVLYPPATELFITTGDDPGSESQKPYTPKGQFINIAYEYYLPIPILGMFLKIGDAEPQYVYDRYVIPAVREMGADALTNAQVQHTPPGPILHGLLGMRAGGMTIVMGQAVKR